MIANEQKQTLKNLIDFSSLFSSMAEWLPFTSGLALKNGIVPSRTAPASGVSFPLKPRTRRKLWPCVRGWRL
jgi:hypothetical protein